MAIMDRVMTLYEPSKLYLLGLKLDILWCKYDNGEISILKTMDVKLKLQGMHFWHPLAVS